MSPAEQNYHVYDKELMAIIKALKHWRRFLEGSCHPILIHTDHKNLIYFTESRILNQRQARWAMDLLAFDFKIKYIPGSKNIIPDSLSRRPDHQTNEMAEYNNRALLDKSVFLCNLRTFITNELDDEIFADQKNSDTYCKLLEEGASGDWEFKNEVLLFKGKIWVYNKDLRIKLLAMFHNSTSGGHNGYKKTVAHLKTRYMWKGLLNEVKNYIKNCDTCLRSKNQNSRPVGLLHPPDLALKPWKAITIDFITGFPNSEGYDAVLVIVDRFTKYSLFIECKKDCSASDLAQIFIKRVYTYFNTPEEFFQVEKQFLHLGSGMSFL